MTLFRKYEVSFYQNIGYYLRFVLGVTKLRSIETAVQAISS